MMSWCTTLALQILLPMTILGCVVCKPPHSCASSCASSCACSMSVHACSLPASLPAAMCACILPALCLHLACVVSASCLHRADSVPSATEYACMLYNRLVHVAHTWSGRHMCVRASPSAIAKQLNLAGLYKICPALSCGACIAMLGHVHAA